jgi:hypothetical protein
VPILHANYQGSFDIDTAFLSPVLIRVSFATDESLNLNNLTSRQLFATIIYGPNAATVLLRGQPIGSSTMNETVAKLWGLTHTTPGAVAISAMLVSGL